jgi:hypothetical protein
MKKTVSLLLAGLLLAAPVGQLSARAAAFTLAEAALDSATTSRVLRLAAPEFGMTEVQLSALYDAGQVQIDDLGPIRGGHRYGVAHGTQWFPIDDIYI